VNGIEPPRGVIKRRQCVVRRREEAQMADRAAQTAVMHVPLILSVMMIVVIDGREGGGM